MTRIDTRLTFALLASTALAGPALGQALPTGASVVHGGVAISNPSPTALAIQQSTGTAIVNWQGFSIGQGARVDITQPSAQSSLLNRVTGATPSTIAGQLTANGRVYLVNPNGIVITRSGTVNTGAFVASSLDISDDDFKAGRRLFTGNGSSAAVVNEGTISVGAGGYAALLGGRVENSGTISVPMGQVGLGSGEQIRLDLSGDGFLQVAVPTAAPSGDRALVDNSGRIRAPGGRIEIKAASAREAARNVINVSGVVEARSVSGRNGAIVLGGGEGGRVTVSGRLDASGGRRQARRAVKPASSYARGGDITVTGDDIQLVGARIDASGAGGGGSVRIGGDYQGGGTLQRATTTSIDAASTVRADALAQGDGGRVIVWSDRLTTFDGLISARGGPLGGNGGFAEVSGKAVLAYNGTTDLSATNGTFGTLLLDPYNVTISTAPSTGTGFTATGPDTNINVTTLTNALATANVTVTTGTGGTQAGNLTVVAPVTWTAATNLTLQAANLVAINAAVTAPSGGLTVASNTSTAAAPIDVASFVLSQGSWSQVDPGLPAFSARNFTLPTSALSSFIRAQGGNGTAANPYVLVDVYGLQGAQSGRSYVLGGNIDASGTAGWNGGAGFQPLTATNVNLDGRTFSVNGLTINRPTTDGVGLFATTSGFISNLQLTNVNIIGGSQVGALTGSFTGGGTIANVGATGSVRGVGTVGGLVGLNTGTITNAVSGVAVTGTLDSVGGLVGSSIGTGTLTGSSASGPVAGRNSVGGLVGTSNDPIATSSASGTVSGTNFVGGLVGNLAGGLGAGGTVDQSSATGEVTGSQSVGGLIGRNVSQGTIAGTVFANTVRFSFAAGRVSGVTDVGGLIGTQQSTYSVTQSYATGAVSGTTNVGGLIGNATAPGPGSGQGIFDTFATGAVTGTTNVGGLIGDQNLVPVGTSYAIGAVSGQSNVGGLSGSGTGSATNSYWDLQTTGRATSAGTGARGLTTTLLQAALPTGFSTARWTSGIGGVASYPYLVGTARPAIIDATAGGNPAPVTPTVPTDPTIPTTPTDPTTPTNPTIPGIPTVPVDTTRPTVPIVPASGLPIVVAASDLAALAPTLAREFTRSALPAEPRDAVIDINLGGGGPIFGPAAGSPESGLGNRGSARATLDFLRQASQDLERSLAQCEAQAGQGSYRTCVAAALAQYADAIETRVLTLPSPLRNVAAVIRQAAAGVRTAPTLAGARAIVRAAIVEVRKAIALIRVDDRVVGRLQTVQGNVIAGALASVDRRLARAVGL